MEYAPEGKAMQEGAGGEYWGGYSGGGGGIDVNPPSALAPVQSMTQLGGPCLLAYGYVHGVGTILGPFQNSVGVRYLFSLLGEGEWDGIERFFIDRKLVDHTDTAIVHFHGGTDGELGHGLAIESNGGDQRVDNFWSSMPASLQPTTFSRTAYLGLAIQPDAKAPSSTVDFFGHYRALKVRSYDNTGTLITRAFSTCPVWQILDLRIRRLLQSEALVGAALAAAVAARIDFPSLVDTETYCNEVLASGAKRFEWGGVIGSHMSLGDAEKLIARACRLYLRETNGKLQILVNQPRSSTFVLTDSHTIGLANFNKKKQDKLPNRLVGVFRDLNPRASATIASISRTANVIDVVTTGPHPFVVGDDAQSWDVPTFADLNTAGVISAQPDDTHFSFPSVGPDRAAQVAGKVGTAESRFAVRAITVDHEPNQMHIGTRGLGLAAMPTVIEEQVDLGVNTWERGFRVLKSELIARLGPMDTPYREPWSASGKARLESVDAGDNALIAQLNGDLISVDERVSEEYQGEYELGDVSIALPIGGEPGTIDFELKEYDEDQFVDAADDEPIAISVPTAKGLAPITTVDDGGAQIVKVSTPLNPQGSINPQLIEASATLAGAWPGADPVIRETVFAGNIYLPDGSAIAVPGSGPTDLLNWLGVAVVGTHAYNGNIVWDIEAGAIARQEYDGAATKATKKDAYLDGFIPINYGIDVTTPAAPGGSGGGGGGIGCFAGRVRAKTPYGFSLSYRQIERAGGVVVVIGRFGPKVADLIVHDAAPRWMLDMGGGELVTLDHLFWSTRLRRAVRARALFGGQPILYRGKVYNLKVRARRVWERWYELENGQLTSNSKES